MLSFSATSSPVIKNLSATEMFVRYNIDIIDYDILKKIVYHQPKVLKLETIKLDRTLIALAGLYYGNIFEGRINDLPLELQMYIVAKDPFIIKHIKVQHEELCIIALKKMSCSLSYIHNKYITDKVGILAITKDIENFKHIINPSLKTCIEAIRIKPSLLDLVRYQDDSICFVALDQDINSYKYIKYPSTRITQYYNKKLKSK